MIQKAVEKWEEKKQEIRNDFENKFPKDYKELVTTVLTHIYDKDHLCFDIKNMTELDHGDYQGTLLYILPKDTYQPSTYWAVKVAYGSCSGCDTLQDIRETYSAYVLSNLAKEDAISDLMVLALHIVQRLKEI